MKINTKEGVRDVGLAAYVIVVDDDRQPRLCVYPSLQGYDYDKTWVVKFEAHEASALLSEIQRWSQNVGGAMRAHAEKEAKEPKRVAIGEAAA
jgi:hypothetical protein